MHDVLQYFEFETLDLPLLSNSHTIFKEYGKFISQQIEERSKLDVWKQRMAGFLSEMQIDHKVDKFMEEISLKLSADDFYQKLL